jgi:hypothetical protein
MPKRHYFKQTESLSDRLTTFAKLMRERAVLLPPGAERTEALAKADQAEEAVKMNRWISSSELKPPV